MSKRNNKMSDWKQRRREKKENLQLKALLHFLEECNTPRSLSYSLLLNASIKGDTAATKQIQDLDLDVSMYVEGEFDRFSLDYQADKLVKSFTGYKDVPESERQLAALRKFIEAEKVNRDRNDLFSRSDLVIREIVGMRVWNTLLEAQSLVAHVLGNLEPETLVGRHGSGATAAARGVDSDLHNKLLFSDATAKALEYIERHLADASPYIMGALAQKQTVAGSRMIFVPKTSFIERIIALEPTLNMWLQEAAGDMIKKKLTKVGIYIDRGGPFLTTDLHGSLAEWSSAGHADLATLDLSSASDRWAVNVVKFLLRKTDPRWTQLLLAARSPKIMIEDRYFTLQMYASMGNATTFPVETLLFWAIAQACNSRGLVSVYGDDIICESNDAQYVAEVLTTLGHKINTEKSYSSGLFRESCGFDYFQGKRIFKAKHKNTRGVPYDFVHIQLHNMYWRLGSVPTCEGMVDPRHARVCNRIRGWHGNAKSIPCVPHKYGDVGWHSMQENWKIKRKSWIYTVEGKLFGAIPTNFNTEIGDNNLYEYGASLAMTYALTGGMSLFSSKCAKRRWKKVNLSIS
uniref:RNA-directed RNA polymerase n=1 Tax=Larsen virus TaxID=2707233 RepID=A0A6H0DIN1_9VIRU|nr:MAG: RNA-dependent RNA polymerase [Larsen virus]